MSIGNVKSGGSGPIRPNDSSASKGQPIRAVGEIAKPSAPELQGASAKGSDTPDVDVHIAGKQSELSADQPLSEERLREIEERIANGFYRSSPVMDAIIEGYLREYVLREP